MCKAINYYSSKIIIIIMHPLSIKMEKLVEKTKVI